MSEDQVNPSIDPNIISEVPGDVGARPNLSVVPDLIDSIPEGIAPEVSATESPVEPQEMIGAIPGVEPAESAGTPEPALRAAQRVPVSEDQLNPAAAARLRAAAERGPQVVDPSQVSSPEDPSVA